MLQLLHLCRIMCNFQNQDTPNSFELCAFVCKLPFPTITSACTIDLKKNDLNICTAEVPFIIFAS